MSEIIPAEQLEAARLRMKRCIAAMLIQALAESGLTYEQVETRLGEKRGFVKNYINSLIEGGVKDMDPMSDMAFAMGFRWKFSAQNLADLLPGDRHGSYPMNNPVDQPKVSDLLPCPFCGVIPVLKGDRALVSCRNVDCSVRPEVSATSPLSGGTAVPPFPSLKQLRWG